MNFVNERLNHLIRKNHGRFKLDDYKQLFIDLNIDDLNYIDLEQADELIEKVRKVFPSADRKCEMMDGNLTINDSALLTEIIGTLNKTDCCYVYIDGYDECGVFKANAISALNKCLVIAKTTYENICFLVDSSFKYSFTIAYYDENDRYDKNTYDIQRKVIG